jgi:hypothetical protein
MEEQLTMLPRQFQGPNPKIKYEARARLQRKGRDTLTFKEEFRALPDGALP